VGVCEGGSRIYTEETGRISPMFQSNRQLNIKQALASVGTLSLRLKVKLSFTIPVRKGPCPLAS
jgi:hypothetical protein